MKTYQYKVQGVDYEVEIVEVEGKIARVNVNGIPFEIEMQKPINAAKHPVLAATKRTTPVAAAPVTPIAPAAAVQSTAVQSKPTQPRCSRWGFIRRYSDASCWRPASRNWQE